MSIASQITALGNNIGAAYNMIGQRGGTIPARKNAENMATAIATIPSGGSTKRYGTLKYLPLVYNNVTVAQVSKTGTFNWSVPNPKKFFESARKLRALKNLESGFQIQINAKGTESTTTWLIQRENTYGEQAYFTVQELQDLGITLTGIQNSGSKSLTLRFDNVTYDTANPTEISISNSGDYLALGAKSSSSPASFNNTFYSICIGDVFIERNQIIEYTFGADCTFIPIYFCYYFHKLEKVFGLENLDIEVIPDAFLNYCESFNSLLEIPETVTRIGGSFLEHCTSFNQPLDLKNVKTIGQIVASESTFLSNCTSFNSPITAPELETWINSNARFLPSCTMFNKPLSLPKLKNISQFLYGCSNFNSSLSLPALETAGYGFLFQCKLFDQPLSLPSLTTTGAYFLYGCSNLNQQISLPSLTTVGYSFMADCTSFNQPLSLPLLTNADYSFMSGCTSFNQSLSIPSIITVGSSFMSGCTSFNQPITIPSSFAVDSAVTYFMYNCNSMVSTITVEASLPTLSSPNGWLATTTSTAECYTTGITIAGPERASWLAALPDRTARPYRKLIDGGAS